MMKRLLLLILVMVLLPTANLEAAREKVRVSIRPFAPPFCFLTKQEGHVGLRGLNIDVLTQLEKIIHVDFEYVSVNSIEKRKVLLQEGAIDLAALVIVQDNRAREPFYIPVKLHLKSRLFVHKSCQTVVCTRDISDKRLAVIAGVHYKSYLDAVKPENLARVDSPLEALKLLNSGQVDVFFAPSERVARYLIQQHHLTNVKGVGIPVDTMHLALAVAPGRTELYEKLKNAVQTLEQMGVMETIREKWDGVPYQPGLWSKYRTELLAGSGMIVLGLLTVLFWNYQLKTKVQRITHDLQTSERRYRTLIESSPDMIFVVDEKGIIQQANEGARSVFPTISPENRNTSYFVDLVRSSKRPEMEGFITEVFDLGSATKFFTLVGPKNERVEVEVAAARILGEHNHPYLACCFARDVTERNRIERELVQADRMATIGKLSAGVAHEINNPLGIMQANVQLILSRGWYDEKAREPLEAILRNAIRAGHITQDLLNVAKPNDPQLAEIDLGRLVRLTLSMLHPQLKGIEVDCRVTDKDTTVFADHNLIQQVLVNILLNAKNSLQDADHGSIKITFCAPPHEDTVCLRIEDNGRGIPKKYLNEVFEPFFTHGKKEGFGLGLFISRRIIERHNGMVYAESETGKGTQIIIELPRKNEAHAAIGGMNG